MLSRTLGAIALAVLILCASQPVAPVEAIGTASTIEANYPR
jgi:hypothetical protein